MSEPVRLAKLAREHLASALKTLQSEDGIPDELMDTADPIAEAMSTLHRIERSGGAVLEGRTEALKKIRASLNQLLGITEEHPAIERVMEAVALALTKVATLVRYTPPPGVVVEAPAFERLSDPGSLRMSDPGSLRVSEPAPAPAMPVVPAVAPMPVPVMASPMPVMASPAPVVIASEPVIAPPKPVAASPRPVVTASEPVVALPKPVVASPAPLAPTPTPVVSTASAPPERPSTRDEIARAMAKPAPADPPAAAATAKPALRPAAGAPSIDVELGTNSASNFYRGLGGDDVVEHGGIFVATYKLPKLGSAVHLRVLLPGNYQFVANAEVRWTRGSGVSVDSASPGFGARFTQISHDGRQLIRRYIRNREPIFYDDL